MYRKCSKTNTTMLESVKPARKGIMGELLKEIRKSKGLTAKYVAEMVGLTQSQFSKREKDLIEFSGSELSKLCFIYDIDIRQFCNNLNA